MSGLFSKPNIPAPVQPPPPPTVDEARAAVETRDQLVKRRGRRASVLTGDGGAASPTVGKPSLIGS